MGFELKVSVSEKSDASLIKVYDRSGIYSTILGNLTGYQHSSTVFLSTVTSASITVTVTNSTTLLLSTTSYTIDVFPTLPNAVNIPYEVTAAQLGYTDGVIPDGMIEVEYSITTTVAGATRTYNTSIQYINRALVCCCIKNFQAEVDACNCSDCDNGEIEASLYAWTLLKGMNRAIGCNKPTKAIEMLKTLQSYCASNDCLECHH